MTLRLSTLGVSNTIATIEFGDHQIVRTYDALPGLGQVRRLTVDCHDPLRTFSVKGMVMNDGCARISRAAASQISRMLGLESVPSVSQARIGGSKGIWMLDASEEIHEQELKWIEITDSQTKFKWHAVDRIHPEKLRMTFEVLTWSSSLTPANLNFQLLPILIDRGVPETAFKALLKQDLEMKVKEIQDAMESGPALRLWIQKNNLIASERTSQGAVTMVGGLPQSNPEKIAFFVDHGFEPATCSPLTEFCRSEAKKYCDRLWEKMNIGVGRSTYAFMIADPLAMLEENEVHIGFSNAFRDPNTGFSETIIHNTDVLVARLPAHLPSDIQKVRPVCLGLNLEC